MPARRRGDYCRVTRVSRKPVEPPNPPGDRPPFDCTYETRYEEYFNTSDQTHYKCLYDHEQGRGDGAHSTSGEVAATTNAQPPVLRGE